MFVFLFGNFTIVKVLWVLFQNELDFGQALRQLKERLEHHSVPDLDRHTALRIFKARRFLQTDVWCVLRLALLVLSLVTFLLIIDFNNLLGIRDETINDALLAFLLLGVMAVIVICFRYAAHFENQRLCESSPSMGNFVHEHAGI